MQDQPDRQYPCPVCLNTMIPGAQRVYSRDPVPVGTGKVWDLEDGAPHLVACSRCEGEGALLNRRDRRERRHQSDRRETKS